MQQAEWRNVEKHLVVFVREHGDALTEHTEDAGGKENIYITEPRVRSDFHG